MDIVDGLRECRLQCDLLICGEKDPIPWGFAKVITNDRRVR